jgi:YfiH family protein
VIRVADGEPFPRDVEADALLTDDGRRAVAVRVADCAPILIASASRRAVAAVHAGWRGTAARVVASAVTALELEFGCRPEDLVVAIGPLIRACCYEVGPSTRQVFVGPEADRWFLPGRQDRLQLDVARANRDQLQAAGVLDAHIYDSGLCTACHPGAFYSYRKEGAVAGRLMGIIRPRTA